MNKAVDKNGKRIFKNRIVLTNDGKYYIVVKIGEYKGNAVVLGKALAPDENGLWWLHTPHVNLTQLSKQEQLIYLLKQEYER